METRMGSFEGKLSSLETKLTKEIDTLDKRINTLDKKMKRGFKSIDRKLDVIINYFDHENIDVRKRLNRVELHLGLAPLNS
jgi:chaperonin cofactor prefoldin